MSSSSFADRDADDTLGILSDVSELLQASNAAVTGLRRKTVPRVMMSGCVDLMHSGHVACFQEASRCILSGRSLAHALCLLAPFIVHFAAHSCFEYEGH